MKIRFEDAQIDRTNYASVVRVIEIEPGDMRLDDLINQLSALRDRLGQGTPAHVVYQVDHEPDLGARPMLSIHWASEPAEAPTVR